MMKIMSGTHPDISFIASLNKYSAIGQHLKGDHKLYVFWFILNQVFSKVSMNLCQFYSSLLQSDPTSECSLVHSSAVTCLVPSAKLAM